MIESVSSTTTTTSASEAMKETIGMDKDDFLKLFITQLENQDPLNPMDSTEYVSQLAQFTQLEQAYNTNTNLESILGAINTSSTLSVVSFVGNEITAAGDKVYLEEGSETELHFTVAKDAEAITVNILDASGTVVRTLSLGETDAGETSLTWDGKDDSGNRLSSGSYTFAATGLDESGDSITCETFIRGTVDGVNFSGSVPILLVGGLEVSFSNLLQVGV